MNGVFHVSEAVSLALHGMGLLAVSREERLRVRDMARSVGASEAHMSKVFQRLVKAGLVRSVRGPQGGFQLSRAPESISLYQVYRAMEGDGCPGSCLMGMDRCPFSRCLFGRLPRAVNDAFMDHMRCTCLADVLPGDHEGERDS